MVPEVTPEALAQAVTRAIGRSPADAGFRRAFLEAALRVALADRDLHIAESELLRHFARALDFPVAGLPGWELIGQGDAEAS